jgi:hypothetical protein
MAPMSPIKGRATGKTALGSSPKAATAAGNASTPAPTICLTNETVKLETEPLVEGIELAAVFASSCEDLGKGNLGIILSLAEILSLVSSMSCAYSGERELKVMGNGL